MCFYDLQKAFDLVKFPVLLHRLGVSGVNSKTWRLLQNWYTNSTSSVRMGCHSSPTFQLQQGVRQGSILSPFLFLLVMDPLLRQLQSHSLGISINNTYAGGYLHADDIHTLASSMASMEAQIDMVETFASDNLLQLNKTKCVGNQQLQCYPQSQAMMQVPTEVDSLSDKVLNVWDTCGGRTFPQRA